MNCPLPAAHYHSPAYLSYSLSLSLHVLPLSPPSPFSWIRVLPLPPLILFWIPLCVLRFSLPSCFSPFFFLFDYTKFTPTPTRVRSVFFFFFFSFFTLLGFHAVSNSVDAINCIDCCNLHFRRDDQRLADESSVRADPWWNSWQFSGAFVCFIHLTLDFLRFLC